MDEINEKYKPFDYSNLFDLLFNLEVKIPISKLYHLSDMPVAAQTEFNDRWRQVAQERREVIARHMADICEDNFTVDYSPFAALFIGDSSEGVRLAGLDLLWDSTDTRLVDLIIAAMRADASQKVRASAAATLGHYVLMSQWGEIDPAMEDPIVTALLEQIDHPSTQSIIRRAALESLASSSSPRIPALIQKAYEDADSTLNQAAVFAMGRSADPRWIPFVTRELDNDDPEMRAEAARAAGEIGSSEFSSRLAEMARYDEDIEVQLAAIYALGQIGNDLAAGTLTEMGDDEDYEDLHEAIDEALDELMIMGLDLDLSLLDWVEEGDDEDGQDEIDF